MPPRVLDDLPLGVRQWLCALRTIITLQLSSPQTQQLRRWRWRGRWRRLPARHPPAAQQPGGSQEGPGEVGSEGGGEGDGELRPHGGSWGESQDDFEIKLKELKGYLLTQCSTLQELKSASKPEMEPRYTKQNLLCKVHLLF